MPYITSVERIGIQKGLQQGALGESQQLIIETLDERLALFRLSFLIPSYRFEIATNSELCTVVQSEVHQLKNSDRN